MNRVIDLIVNIVLHAVVLLIVIDISNTAFSVLYFSVLFAVFQWRIDGLTEKLAKVNK